MRCLPRLRLVTTEAVEGWPGVQGEGLLCCRWF